MRTLSAAALFALISSIAAAQPASHAMRPTASANVQQPTGKPVARVNGAVLTDRDLLREMYAMFPYARQHNGGFPKAMEGDIRAGAMKMMEFEELVYQEAQRRKLTVPPAKMSQALVDFRKQFGTPEDFQAFLNAEFNGSQDALKIKIVRSILIEQLLKTEVADKASLSNAELRAYYDKNADRFKSPEMLQFQTISILVPNDATPAQKEQAHKKAEDALRQAKATKTYDEFGLLAEKVSEDDYRVMMGDHKGVDRAKLPPEVTLATNAMKEGQVSDLVRVGPSYCILRLNGHTPAAKQSFEAVKKSLREELERKRTEQLRSGLDKKLRMSAKVEEL